MKARKHSIATKLTVLILTIAIAAGIITAGFSVATLLVMRSTTLESVTEDAVSRLTEMAQSKAEIADSQLLLAQNQTKLVAEGMQKIYANAKAGLPEYDEAALPDLSCSNTELLGKYSMHVRVPESLLSNVEKTDGTVTFATLNRAAELDSGYSVNDELYLGSLLANELSQIERFRNADGSYTGFSATYFCFADSGIDVLGDLETQKMICYDARNSGWYKAAVEAYNNGTLENGVYWTEPVQDGSGRGISLICAMPVVVDGQLIGVAGSGGLLINFAELVRSTSLGDTGYSFVVNRDSSKVIINPNTTATEATVSEVSIETVLSASENADLTALAAELQNTAVNSTTCQIDGTAMLVAYSALSNTKWTMVTVIAQDDELIMGTINTLDSHINRLFVTFAVLLAVLVGIIVLISGAFAKKFTAPIITIKDGAKIIAKGGEGLSHRIDVTTGDELEELSHSFNHMATDLGEYMKNLQAITAEKERIGAELSIATQIQSSMLPRLFPAFPDVAEYTLYATMDPAKEVGGDFYDFFMIDRRHLAIVVADVSGKGVPAALFMVIGKTLIKDHTTPGTDLGKVFSEVNNLLCASNSENLFITCFEGVLDLATGEFRFANAGHEMPCIRHGNGDYEFYKIRPGFVLAGMENMRFKPGMLQLEPGDRLVQYTDGVTEATNARNELFGNARLLASLNAHKDAEPAELLPALKADIDAFVGDAPQFDDITMLALHYVKRLEISEEE